MRDRGMEIAGYKKRCSISELPVIRYIQFPCSLSLCLKRDFCGGSLKRMKSAKKWPNRLGSKHS